MRKGGMIYGGDGFEQDCEDISYDDEMDINGIACGIEAGVWDGGTVPAVFVLVMRSALVWARPVLNLDIWNEWRDACYENFGKQ